MEVIEKRDTLSKEYTTMFNGITDTITDLKKTVNALNHQIAGLEDLQKTAEKKYISREEDIA